MIPIKCCHQLLSSHYCSLCCDTSYSKPTTTILRAEEVPHCYSMYGGVIAGE